MEFADVVILGAGAAGLFCAGVAFRPGLRVIVLDHAKKPGEKIRISGGGRCNFTNLASTHERFISQNKRFCASALAAYRPEDFVALVDQAGIAWHEKTQGQLFCDGRATQIIDMLVGRMQGAELRLEVSVASVTRRGEGFLLQTSLGVINARKIIVATGGKSIPKMGASGLGYDIARDMGLRQTETRAGLVPLTFAEQDLGLCQKLAGVAIEAEIHHLNARFRDALLFTHRGLSGPLILQISNYWQAGEILEIDFLPGIDLAQKLKDLRGQGGRIALVTALGHWLPNRLAQAIADEFSSLPMRLADQTNARIEEIAQRVNHWTIRPVGTEGYRTAEVTLGGVDTRDLDARSMEARSVPGLYFIGEVVDVTGWLGGYNFQWAWASAYAAGRAVAGPPSG